MAAARTFLQLCQKMRLDCGIPGATLTPASVLNQTGTLEKVVAWVKDSWRDIQLRNDAWRWMRSYFTFLTVAGTDSYAFSAATDTRTGSAIARFARWWAHDRTDPFRCYLTSGGQAGEQFLIYMPWQDFRRIYKFGVQASQRGQPVHVSIDDENKLVLGPNPNAVYTISGSFQRGTQELAADGDTPDMPADFHDLIVYYGMEHYAFNSVAPEVLSRAQTESSRLVRALERNQGPAWRRAGALA